MSEGTIMNKCEGGSGTTDDSGEGLSDEQTGENPETEGEAETEAKAEADDVPIGVRFVGEEALSFLAIAHLERERPGEIRTVARIREVFQQWGQDIPHSSLRDILREIVEKDALKSERIPRDDPRRDPQAGGKPPIEFSSMPGTADRSRELIRWFCDVLKFGPSDIHDIDEIREDVLKKESFRGGGQQSDAAHRAMIDQILFSDDPSLGPVPRGSRSDKRGGR